VAYGTPACTAPADPGPAALPLPCRHGQALIQYGERGDELYLIRYGKVRVVVPNGKGGGIEVAVLGRGQFVGERAVINDRLRRWVQGRRLHAAHLQPGSPAHCYWHPHMWPGT
jgi:CRP-like cAMP-binding protein